MMAMTRRDMLIDLANSREGADVSPVTFSFGRAPSSAASAC